MTLVKTETVTVDERSDVLIQLDEMMHEFDGLFGEIAMLGRSLAPVSKQHRVTVRAPHGGIVGEDQCEARGEGCCAQSQRRGPEAIGPMILWLRERLERAQKELSEMRHNLQLG